MPKRQWVRRGIKWANPAARRAYKAAWQRRAREAAKLGLGDGKGEVVKPKEAFDELSRPAGERYFAIVAKVLGVVK